MAWKFAKERGWLENSWQIVLEAGLSPGAVADQGERRNRIKKGDRRR